jgi:hypothetical protein
MIRRVALCARKRLMSDGRLERAGPGEMLRFLHEP